MSDSERDRLHDVVANLEASGLDCRDVTDALLVAGFGDVTALRAERDLAREDCGHQRAMRESIRAELYTFVGLKVAAEAERDALRAQVAAVEALHLKCTNEGLDYCPECDRVWPCDTVRALTGGA